MKKFIALALALVMCLALVAACGDGGSASGDTIKIGVFEPVTGENGGGGYQEVIGIRYANSLRNTVTIDGKEYKVELKEVDNKSDKTEAVSAAQTLVSEGVSAVLGSYGSGVSIAAAFLSVLPAIYAIFTLSAPMSIPISFAIISLPPVIFRIADRDTSQKTGPRSAPRPRPRARWTAPTGWAARPGGPLPPEVPRRCR